MTDEEYKQALAEMAMINTIFHPRPDLYPPAIYPNNDLLIELLILKRKGLVQITNLGFEEEVLPERRPANDVEERAWIASRMRPGNASMKDQMWAAFRILQRRLPGAKLEVAEHALPRGFYEPTSAVFACVGNCDLAVAIQFVVKHQLRELGVVADDRSLYESGYKRKPGVKAYSLSTLEFSPRAIETLQRHFEEALAALVAKLG